MELSSTSQPQTNPTEFDLTPEQSLFAGGTDKRFYGYVSGVGAGKTFAGIARAVANMLSWNPGEMGAIIAPTRTMVIDVIVSEMRDLGLFDRGFTYQSAHTEEPGIHGPNGSRALILSADNTRTVERLKGLNLAWWWIDEEAEVPPRAREILMQRLRTGSYRNGFITTTPKGKNHTYDFFVGDVSTEDYEYGAGTVYRSEKRLAITGVPTWANPNTPGDYHESMQDLPDAIRAQEVEGQFIEIGTGIFTRDMFSFIHPSEIKDDWNFKTIIAVDPAATVDAQKAEDNDSDYWAVTSLAIHSRSNTVLVTDTARRRGMSLSEGVDWLGAIARKSRDATMVVESNQGQVFLQNALKDAGVHAKPVKNTRNKEDRILDISIPLSNMVKFVDWNAVHESDLDDNPELAKEYKNQKPDSDGFYKPPGKGHPYQDLISELLSWPEGSHDDQADSLALALEHCPVSWGTSILGANPYQSDDEQS